MTVRPLIPDLKAGRLASVSLPYDAIKDWSAVEGIDFVDGTERIEFLIAGTVLSR